MTWITDPDDPQFDKLCRQLAELAEDVDVRQDWPDRSLALCAEQGVFRWFLPAEYGGCGWSPGQIARGYMKLSAACLTTTFVITQYTAACRRIVGGDRQPIKASLLPKLAKYDLFATVGISHLTTSRRHLINPVLTAQQVDGGFLIDGMAPWVTGGVVADVIVTGAVFDDGRQVLLAVPTTLPGVRPAPTSHLVALTGSRTGAVHFDQCFVPVAQLLAGPSENVLQQGAGGVQTSTLAVGVATAAIRFLEQQAQARTDLESVRVALAHEMETLRRDLLEVFDASAAVERVCSAEELRTRANSLVLRASQAALAAAKGAGFVAGHPAGRWCREALFFLVWSCPQGVVNSNLCELAGIESV